ncbi:F0F1 ATP synthase subunit B [Candidatus Dojkabacteria bacterium]|uniref:ATP synthase subunit b n=1 Tax=Candidatus Dojkabacteria bacterium TaxID=2099670 RepID=A0A5C7J6Y3_9BACT|nr:MAG: F0F1 ATP synthase subunit B [Candidatus Dojkabacteria bacterium]
MEILEKLGVDWKLLLAQAVNFLVLLWVLKRFAYKPILTALEARTKRIEQGLKDAEASQSKLQGVIEEEKKILSPVREEARSILREAEGSAKKRDALMLDETKKKIDRMIAEADAHLAENQAKLLREAQAELAEIVLLATKKVLNEKVETQLDTELIKKSLS